MSTVAATDAKRVAVVTGVTGGLGPAVLRAFLDSGAVVVGTYRDSQAAKETRGQIGDADDGLALERVELTDRAEVERLVTTVVDRWDRLDYLINVAGGWAGGKPVWETQDDELERMLSVNLRTAFLSCRAVVPQLLRQRFGRIVNVGSRTAVRAEAGAVAYGIAKAGLVRLTETLALDLRRAGDHDITANCVLPSVIDTPENRKAMPKADFSKWVTSEQVAAVIHWLTTDEAAPISGTAIPVYGRA